MDFEILEKLNGFSHVQFEDRRHIYTIGSKTLTSVTTILKKYSSDKDWVGIDTKYTAKNGESPEYWQEKWKLLLAAKKKVYVNFSDDFSQKHQELLRNFGEIFSQQKNNFELRKDEQDIARWHFLYQ